MSTAQVNSVFQIGGGTLPSNGSGAGSAAGPSGVTPIGLNVCTVYAGTGPGGATANNYCVFIPQSGTFGEGAHGTANDAYKVSAGKTGISHGFYWLSAGAANAALVSFGYSTSIPASINTATVPTGPVYFSGAVSTSNFFNAQAANTLTWYPLPMQFPAGAYPWIQTYTVGQNYLIYMVVQEI